MNTPNTGKLILNLLKMVISPKLYNLLVEKQPSRSMLNYYTND